jgi:hypothetical protein
MFSRLPSGALILRSCKRVGEKEKAACRIKSSFLSSFGSGAKTKVEFSSGMVGMVRPKGMKFVRSHVGILVGSSEYGETRQVSGVGLVFSHDQIMTFLNSFTSFPEFANG